MSMNRIICGDSLKVLPTLPKAKCIFADPPDNLGMKYEGFHDRWETATLYRDWLCRLMSAMQKSDAPLLWLSVYYRHRAAVEGLAERFGIYRGRGDRWDIRWFIWHYTFGQQQSRDFKSTHRPILRLMKPDATVYPEAVKEQSQRQRNGDKRAKEGGCVPGDVWTFSRVCGNYNERRRWSPNQHPEALVERIVKFSAKPGDLVIDMFAGSGTVNRVCKQLGIDCIGIDISDFHCRKISEETCAEFTTAAGGEGE